MSKDNVIDFNALKNNRQKKGPAVSEQEEAELSELFAHLTALPDPMQKYINSRFIYLMMFSALATHVADMLKKNGYDPEDFEPEEDSANAFLSSGPYFPEDDDPDFAWNGPMFDAVRNGVTYRVASTITPDGKDDASLTLDLLKQEGESGNWQIFADGEWQPGPSDEYFDYLSIMRDWADDEDDDDWDDEDPPESIHDLDLSISLISALVSSGIETVEELCGKTAGELLKIKGIGRKSVARIEEELDYYGLRLKE